jgi:stomatin prohibitin-like protein membrane protease subunits|nr:MAG TPA: High frequency of lysogenization C protein [Caudoviricetes sp.]
MLKPNPVENSKAFVKKYGFVALGAMAIIVVLNSYFTVDAGEKGVIRRFGETIRVVDAGLGFKIPVVDSLITISTRDQSLSFGTRRKDGEVGHGLNAYTRDQQSVNAALTITYNVTDPIGVYDRYRTIENMVTQIIEPRVRSQVETTFGQFTVQTSITERARLSDTLQNNIRKALECQPISVNSVQLSEIKYSDAYEKGIELSMQKNIEIQTKERQLTIAQKEAEIIRTQAQAEADAQIIQARAEAEKVKLQGEAEAQAIKAKGEALRENQQLVSLTAAERWDGKLPETMLPNSTVPFIQMPNNGAK